MKRPSIVWLVLLLSCCKTGTPEEDAGVDDAAPDESLTPGGKLVINELMPDPFVAFDNAGEWLELYNPTQSEVSLDGWRLKDDRNDAHTIKGPLSVAPGRYLVLGRGKDKGANGGVPVDYAYGDTFNLNNGDDEVVLLDAAGTEVDRVAYKGSWGIYPGVSLSLKGPADDNAIAASWCPGANPWPGSSGDKGSPGALNTCGNPPPPKPDGGGGELYKISFNESLCAGIKSGVKKTTLRNGHWTNVVAGQWVRLVCSTSGTTFKAQLTMVRLTTWGGILPEEYKADGFSSQENMMQIMATYYPGITLTDKATVIGWDQALPYP